MKGADSEHPPTNDGAGHLEEGPTTVSANRVKVYVKPSRQASEEVLARRARKNAQSRSRASKHRQRIAEVEKKPESERTPEEVQLYETHQTRRQRKNDRSRERALEKKEEIEKILAKPENKRTRIEMQFLETALGAKKRKNEGDRLRRNRLKNLGLSPKSAIGKPGIPARGPLPTQYQHLAQKEGPVPAHNGYGMPPPYGAHPMMNPHHHHEHPAETTPLIRRCLQRKPSVTAARNN